MREPAPLTTREEELQEIKRNEVNTEVSIDSRHQTLSGVAFPITEASKKAICDMASGSYDYLQFRIGTIRYVNYSSQINLYIFFNLDLDEELIHLVTAGNVSLDKLPSKVPTDSARYHVFNFKHTHEGDYMENLGKSMFYYEYYFLKHFFNMIMFQYLFIQCQDIIVL